MRNMNYGKVDDDLLVELKSIVGPDHVITDPEALDKYARDETPLEEGSPPDVAVLPGSTEEVSRVLSLANEHLIPVTFRGQGTGLSCGAVPLLGGILMTFERMNRILEIDEENLMAVLEGGVVLMPFREEVEKRGLFYPADPGERTSAIGGNVATNAGGMNGVKYGKTRDYILGLEVVLPSGKVLQFGGKTVKRSMGYELMQLVIGSEGTLAAITKVYVKLSKLPGIFMTLYVPFNDLHAAVASVCEILKNRITPTAMEFVERDAIVLAEEHLEKTMPHHDSDAYLIMRIEADKEEDLYEEAEAISEICSNNGAVDVLVADTPESQSRIWDIRSHFYEAVVKARVAELVDAAVPRGRIADFMHAVKEISGKHGMRIIGYGHAGDGNIHLHPLRDELSEEEWEEKLPEVMKEIYGTAVSFGGTVSGEHGIGSAKLPYVSIALDEDEMRIMKEIKAIFDPNNILNPGKILD
jgi:glycolate oxidase